MGQLVAMLLVLIAIYGIIIVVLVRLFRNFFGESQPAVFLGFLAFGLVSGLVVTLLWPHDSSVLPNIFAVWLGDWIYRQSIAWVGDPYSSQAHDTIPWILQVPQVYPIASTALCASLGLVLQRIFYRRRI